MQVTKQTIFKEQKVLKSWTLPLSLTFRNMLLLSDLRVIAMTMNSMTETEKGHKHSAHDTTH